MFYVDNSDDDHDDDDDDDDGLMDRYRQLWHPNSAAGGYV